MPMSRSRSTVVSTIAAAKSNLRLSTYQRIRSVLLPSIKGIGIVQPLAYARQLNSEITTLHPTDLSRRRRDTTMSLTRDPSSLAAYIGWSTIVNVALQRLQSTCCHGSWITTSIVSFEELASFSPRHLRESPLACCAADSLDRGWFVRQKDLFVCMSSELCALRGFRMAPRSLPRGSKSRQLSRLARWRREVLSSGAVTTWTRRPGGIGAERRSLMETETDKRRKKSI